LAIKKIRSIGSTRPSLQTAAIVFTGMCRFSTHKCRF